MDVEEAEDVTVEVVAVQGPENLSVEAIDVKWMKSRFAEHE